MLKIVCPACDKDWDSNHQYHYRQIRVPRGSLREREGRDVADAILKAAFWPPHLAWFILATTAKLLGDGVKAAVTRATPLTPPELERRIREQQTEIKRLSDQMNDDA